MSVNLYFSKIDLPNAKDFPILKAVSMQPVSLTFQGGTNRLWLMMSKVQAAQNGSEESVQPAYPFYSDDRGATWNIYHHGFASAGKFKSIKSAADGTVIAAYDGNTYNLLLRLDEQPDNTMKFHQIVSLTGYNSWALGGDNLIFTYKAVQQGYPVNSLEYYLGGSQSKGLCNTVSGHLLSIAQMDVGSDGAFYAVVNGVPNFPNVLCHILKKSTGWEVQPTTSAVQIEQVIVASAAEVYAVPHQSSLQLYFYSGESRFLPVHLYNVVGSDIENIPGKIMQSSAISSGKMCLIMEESKQVKVGSKMVTEFTNTAYIQAPDPVD